ncbi:MAG: glycoside hydrolase family 36 protein [Clostridia bacterium]
MRDFKFILEFKTSIYGKIIKAEGNETEYYKIESEYADNKIKIKLLPKNKLFLINAYLMCEYEYDKEDRVFCNGYQSWTNSREFKTTDYQEGLRGLSRHLHLIKRITRIFGDYNFQNYSRKQGEFSSYSYTYIKRKGDVNNIEVWGTTNERTGFTIFHHDINKNMLTLQKDVEGVSINSAYTIFDVVMTQGDYNKAFDEYFKILNLPNLKYKHLSGYTSWYNYYGGINEKILTRDLEGLSTVGDKANLFQIDDGFQTATGDWLLIKKNLFPNGMKYLVDKIHDKNYSAGLWLAPFSAQIFSKVAKEHKDWFVRNPSGNRQIGAIAWNGAYTLDFYQEEVRAYIKNFFDVVLNEWGFDMVKLDFLYSICRTPRYNKSRGQIMCEAMDFLRECVGDKIILGCGVPLFPSFGKVDLCRISSDVGPSFTDQFYCKHTNQEFISTKNAMNNTLFRRHLDGRAFVNDPDVFYVRKSNLKGIDPLAGKKTKLVFTDKQKELLAKVNNMCGNVLFVSDNVGDFDEKQKELLLKTFEPNTKNVIDVNYVDNEHISVIYKENEHKYKLTFDINLGDNKTEEIK